MPDKPTLVFVPGAWYTPEIWDKISSLLESQDCKCIRSALPTASSNTSASFSDDIVAARNAILTETTQGHNVVIIVHSYGSSVGSSAIEGMIRPKRDTALPPTDTESSGHVLGIIMMASFFHPTGVTFMEGLNNTRPPSWRADYGTGLATLVLEPRDLFYHDLPVEEGSIGSRSCRNSH